MAIPTNTTVLVILGTASDPTVLGGRILASLVLERKNEWSTCGLIQPLNRAFPPDPIRYAVAGPGCKFDYISRREGIIIVPAHAPFPS